MQVPYIHATRTFGNAVLPLATTKNRECDFLNANRHKSFHRAFPTHSKRQQRQKNAPCRCIDFIHYAWACAFHISRRHFSSFYFFSSLPTAVSLNHFSLLFYGRWYFGGSETQRERNEISSVIFQYRVFNVCGSTPLNAFASCGFSCAVPNKRNHLSIFRSVCNKRNIFDLYVLSWKWK